MSTPAPRSDDSASNAAEAACRARAQELYEKGHLWRAQRSLARCAPSPDARRLAEHVAAALGQGQGTSVQGDRSGIPGSDSRQRPDWRDGDSVELTGELEVVQRELAEGDCDAARDAARASVAHWIPNPEAWLLMARAADCLGEPSDAHSFRSRAAKESESAGLSWGLFGQWGASVRWDTAGGPLISTANRGFRLNLASLASGLWRMAEMEGHSWPLWTDARVSVHLDGNRLVGRGTDETELWRVEFPDAECNAAPAFDEETLVLACRMDGCRVSWREVRGPTGAVTAWRTVRGCYINNLRASPSTPWFTFNDRPVASTLEEMVWVERQGRTERWTEQRFHGCTVCGIASERRFIADCEGELTWIDVPSLERTRTAGTAKGAHCRFIDGPGGLGAVISSEGIAILGTRGPAPPSRPEPLQGQKWTDAGWSPDGRSLVGATEQRSGTREILVWDVEHEKVLFRSTSVAPRNRSGVSIHPSGNRLAFTSCSRALRLDLLSSTLQELPLPGLGCFGSVAYAEQRVGVFSPGQASGIAWESSGPIRDLPASSPFPETFEVQSGGSFVALLREDGVAETVLELSPDPRSVRLERYQTLVGLSRNGRHVAALDRRQDGSEVWIARLSSSWPARDVIWRSPIERRNNANVLFSDESAFVRLGAKTWQRVSLPDGRAEPAPSLAAWDDAIQVARDGKRVLLRRGATTRIASPGPDPTGPGVEQELPTWASKRLLSPRRYEFALDDRWVIAPSERGALVWNVLDGKFAGEFIVPASGGLVFAYPAPGNPDEALVDVLGEAARAALFCRIGNQRFPWEACEERFEEPGALRRLIVGAR